MADNQTTAAEPTNGRVTRVQGSVIDVEFPVGHLPDIYNALKVTIVNTSAKEEGEAKETEITLEVEQHLGDSTVRCVALKPTDGLVRGASVSDTGAPISVPVGDVTKGHVFDVSGNILNKKPDETKCVGQQARHRHHDAKANHRHHQHPQHFITRQAKSYRRGCGTERQHWRPQRMLR